MSANSGFAIVRRSWVDSAIAVFWLVITTNAFNLIDGLDGLAAGVGAVGATAVAATKARLPLPDLNIKWDAVLAPGEGRDLVVALGRG